MKYIQLTPDLEAKIKPNPCNDEDFNPYFFSLNKDEVKSRLVHYDLQRNEFYFLIPPGEDHDTKRNVYMFSNVFIHFNPDCYDARHRLVKLGAPNDLRCFSQDPEFYKLHPELEKRFQQLRQKTEIDLIELIEELNSIAKDSIEFDFSSQYAKERLSHFADSYKPLQFANIKGVCEDAGNRFRWLLNRIGLPKNIAYAKVGAYSSKGPSHDNTLIIDLSKGTWFAVNSLSPNPEKQFNIATKEQLKILGDPYYFPDEPPEKLAFSVSDRIQESEEIDSIAAEITQIKKQVEQIISTTSEWQNHEDYKKLNQKLAEKEARKTELESKIFKDFERI